MDEETEQKFQKVRELLERGDVTGAQARLDKIGEQTAEWHYLQSVIYRKRTWFTESRKSIEKAIELDSENENYKKALEELNAMAEKADLENQPKKKKRHLCKNLFERGGGFEGCCEGCSAGCGGLLS